jgi:hypothetical protein
MMQRLLAVATLVAAALAAITSVSAAPQMPKDVIGRWCYSEEFKTFYRESCQGDDIMQMEVTPTGYSAKEADCTAVRITTYRYKERRTHADILIPGSR